MLPIYHNSLAPRLQAIIEVPDLDQSQAEAFVRSLIKFAAQQVVGDSWTWKRYTSVNDSDQAFWTKATSTFKNAVANVAGQIIYNQIISLTGTNPNVLKGTKALTLDLCTSAVRDAIGYYETLYAAGDVPKLSESPPEEKAEIPGFVSSSAILARSVITDLRKSLIPDQLPDIENFVPRNQEAIENYRRTGKVPEGYMDLAMIKALSPGYADELALARVPMLKKAYFEKNVSERVAADMAVNAERWAHFLSRFVPTDGVLLEKASTSQESLLERMSGSNDVQPMELVENYQLVLAGMSKAFETSDPVRLTDVVKGFSDDAPAVVAMFSLLKAGPGFQTSASKRWKKSVLKAESLEHEQTKKSHDLTSITEEADVLLKSLRPQGSS